MERPHESVQSVVPEEVEGKQQLPQLTEDWESWYSGNRSDFEDDSDNDNSYDGKEEDEISFTTTAAKIQLNDLGDTTENKSRLKSSEQKDSFEFVSESAENINWKREDREEKCFLYVNTIPIVGALYGLARLTFYHRQNNSDQVRTSRWGICKNVLNTLTLTIGALIIPLNIPDLICSAIATGVLEGVVDTVLEYSQYTIKEREEVSREEMFYNVVNHAPILGMIYDFPRLLYFAKKGERGEVMKSLWGLAANIVTTAITVISVIKFSLKAMGSIPSGVARSAQTKVTFTLAKKGVQGPIVQAGKVLASKEARKLKRRIKNELSELKTKMKDVDTDNFLQKLGLGPHLMNLEKSDPRLLLRNRLKKFIDAKKSSCKTLSSNTDAFKMD